MGRPKKEPKAEHKAVCLPGKDRSILDASVRTWTNGQNTQVGRQKDTPNGGREQTLAARGALCLGAGAPGPPLPSGQRLLHDVIRTQLRGLPERLYLNQIS